MANSFDVIIIGSGIGGLVAGTYLSKKGYKVLILEKHYRPGGYCSSFKRAGYKFDSGAHLIGSCGEKDSFGNLLKILDVKTEFIRLNPTDRFFFYKGRGIFDTVEVLPDYKEFMAYLKNEFKSEADGIEAFFDEICRTKNPFLTSLIINRYKTYTYQEFLNTFFKNKRLKAILSAQSGFLGVPPNEASAISAIFMLKMFVIDGAFYPKGGAQKLADAFVYRFKKNNGKLMLSANVKKILLKDNQINGVMLDSGEAYYSNFVISNIDCKKTFTDLLNLRISKIDIKIADKLSSFKVSLSSFALYLGLNDGVKLCCKNGWYYDGYDINKNFKDLLYVHIPTNYDSSIVPKRGYQILILYAPFIRNVGKITDWRMEKEKLSEYYLNRLDKLFPGLSKNIVSIEAATPKTFERYTNNRDGALYGWSQIPGQVYLNSFSQATPIKGLYLAGHWTFPGGGVVTVALSGMSAARLVMKAASNTGKAQIKTRVPEQL